MNQSQEVTIGSPWQFYTLVCMFATVMAQEWSPLAFQCVSLLRILCVMDEISPTLSSASWWHRMGSCIREGFCIHGDFGSTSFTTQLVGAWRSWHSTRLCERGSDLCEWDHSDWMHTHPCWQAKTRLFPCKTGSPGSRRKSFQDQVQQVITKKNPWTTYSMTVNAKILNWFGFLLCTMSLSAILTR